MKILIPKVENYFIYFENKVNEVSDWTAQISSSPWFLILHAVWWALWIGYRVEPFPYGLLTLIVSLEAIALSSLILSSGNREAEIEKKITRKNLTVTTENNMMIEEILHTTRDLEEKIRLLVDEGPEKE